MNLSASNGEIIMDYSIYDAVEAGFDKVVFIIRKDIRDAFDKMIGDRISKYVKIDYVYQELDCLPGAIPYLRDVLSRGVTVTQSAVARAL